MGTGFDGTVKCAVRERSKGIGINIRSWLDLSFLVSPVSPFPPLSLSLSLSLCLFLFLLPFPRDLC